MTWDAEFVLYGENLIFLLTHYLVHARLYLVGMAKTSTTKIEGIVENNSDERCAYESLDNRSR